MMSNGYKPAPLDLSDVKLTAGQEVLVDKLAENAHNVWAKDRIKQGWTYGIQQVKAVLSIVPVDINRDISMSPEAVQTPLCSISI